MKLILFDKTLGILIGGPHQKFTGGNSDELHAEGIRSFLIRIPRRRLVRPGGCRRGQDHEDCRSPHQLERFHWCLDGCRVWV